MCRELHLCQGQHIIVRLDKADVFSVDGKVTATKEVGNEGLVMTMIICSQFYHHSMAEESRDIGW